MVNTVTVVTRVTGRYHIELDKPCQDYAGGRVIRCTDGSELLIMAVADGHGDERHDLSAIGSELAVKVALEILMDLARSNLQKPSKEMLRAIRLQFPHQVKRAWLHAINNNAQSRKEDLQVVRYGTTLITCLHFGKFTLICKLGDGNVTVRTINQAQVLWGEQEESRDTRLTDSMCLPDAPNRFETAIVENVQQIMLSTDGLVNSFENYTHLLAVLDHFSGMLGSSDKAEVAHQLEAFASQCTSSGSGDDITISIANFDVVRRTISNVPGSTYGYY